MIASYTSIEMATVTVLGYGSWQMAVKTYWSSVKYNQSWNYSMSRQMLTPFFKTGLLQSTTNAQEVFSGKIYSAFNLKFGKGVDNFGLDCNWNRSFWTVVFYQINIFYLSQSKLIETSQFKSDLVASLPLYVFFLLVFVSFSFHFKWT